MTIGGAGNLLGRILVAVLFILAAVHKITDYGAVAEHMASQHVPAQLLPLVILFEMGAGIALIFGWKSNAAALALAGFCVLAAALFHHSFQDHVETTMFLKDMAIAGGLIAFATRGA